MEEKYFKLLKSQFASKDAVLTEIINLNAICELPKATEHFVSDVHGEYDAFNHVLRNGSGSIKEKLSECFPKMSEQKIAGLASLIYYPEEKLDVEFQRQEDFEHYCRKNLIFLLKVTNYVGKKYSRSKLRKALPGQFAYILEELLTEVNGSNDKENYFRSILDKLQELGQLQALMIALADSIRRLTVDHLHVVGDIYDRGPFPEKIIDRLIKMPSVDVQWGNHDIVWMAAARGSALSIMNVIRICARYGNLDTLEESYGISLRALIDYAERHYEPTEVFEPKIEGAPVSDSEKIRLNQLQQATALLQFKLESQLIARQPDFKLGERDVLRKIDFEKQTIVLGEKIYELQNFQAPTLLPENPAELTDEEKALMSQLIKTFKASDKLQLHVDFLLEKGSMYLKYNGNLLIHGCLPLHENGDFKSFRGFSGQALLDYFDAQVRIAMSEADNQDALDLMWYLWVGECSSLFGKHAMTTFERYYIADKASHVEKKNAYYQLREKPEIIAQILENFGLDGATGHLINGHTPVKEKNGEQPIKAEGKLIVIDGGFSKPYQKETGIAGYTLLYNSFGIQLAQHQPFTTVQDAVENGGDIVSSKRLVDVVKTRKRVKDTNIGEELRKTIADLEELFAHYEKY